VTGSRSPQQPRGAITGRDTRLRRKAKGKREREKVKSRNEVKTLTEASGVKGKSDSKLKIRLFRIGRNIIS
jgi:hypothetical protein